MKKTALSLLMATIVSVNFVYSQEKQQIATEKEGTIIAPAKSMQTIILAGQLAKYGYENNSATALIQAAELYLSAGMSEFKPVSAEKGNGVETTKDEYISHDPKQILTDAKVLAEGDTICLAMISKLENAKTRGAVGGPRIGEYRVLANSIDSYIVKFYANEPATVALSGDGDTDLDLYVFDENGNLIDKDVDYSDDCIVTWNPRWTGNFIIKVVNRGNVYNHYAIATN
jgi:hypothetical protein